MSVCVLKDNQTHTYMSITSQITLINKSSLVELQVNTRPTGTATEMPLKLKMFVIQVNCRFISDCQTCKYPVFSCKTIMQILYKNVVVQMLMMMQAYWLLIRECTTSIYPVKG